MVPLLSGLQSHASKDHMTTANQHHTWYFTLARPIVLELSAIVFALLFVEVLADQFGLSKGRVAFLLLSALIPTFIMMRLLYVRMYIPIRDSPRRPKWHAVFMFTTGAAVCFGIAGAYLALNLVGPRDVAKPHDSTKRFSRELHAKAGTVATIYDKHLTACDLNDVFVDTVKIDLAVVGRTGARHIYVVGKRSENCRDESFLYSAILGAPTHPTKPEDLRYEVRPWPRPEAAKTYGTEYERFELRNIKYYLARSSVPFAKEKRVSIRQGYCAPNSMHAVDDGFFVDLRPYGESPRSVRVSLYVDRPAAFFVYTLDPGKSSRDWELVDVRWAQMESVSSELAKWGIRMGYSFEVAPERQNRILLFEYIRSGATGKGAVSSGGGLDERSVDGGG